MNKYDIICNLYNHVINNYIDCHLFEIFVFILIFIFLASIVIHNIHDIHNIYEIHNHHDIKCTCYKCHNKKIE